METRLARTETKRLRIGGVTVRVEVEAAPEDRERMARCVSMYEDFCVVRQSVRNGVAVDVSLEASDAR